MTENDSEDDSGRSNGYDPQRDPAIQRAAQHGFLLLVGLSLGLVALGLAVGLSNDVRAPARIVVPVVCVGLFVWTVAICLKVARKIKQLK